MQDEDGQVRGTASISAGLDYPGVGPEHSWLKDMKRAKYVSVSDNEVMKAFHMVNQMEGILPALETAHAFAYLDELMPNMNQGQHVVINVSGRGDKDLNSVVEIEDIKL